MYCERSRTVCTVYLNGVIDASGYTALQGAIGAGQRSFSEQERHLGLVGVCLGDRDYTQIANQVTSELYDFKPEVGAGMAVLSVLADLYPCE